MTHKDEIVDEVRAVREAYAARFHHNLAEMYRDLKSKEAQLPPERFAKLQPIRPRTHAQAD